MDLDILLFGDRICDQPGLVLPRPDLVRRAYMLGPAAELAPGTVHPTLGGTLAELWRDFARDGHPMQPVDLGWPDAVRHMSGAAPAGRGSCRPAGVRGCGRRPRR